MIPEKSFGDLLCTTALSGDLDRMKYVLNLVEGREQRSIVTSAVYISHFIATFCRQSRAGIPKQCWSGERICDLFSVC